MIDLNKIARQLVVVGKGILAADESTGTIGKRFAKTRIDLSIAAFAAIADLKLVAVSLRLKMAVKSFTQLTDYQKVCLVTQETY